MKLHEILTTLLPTKSGQENHHRQTRVPADPNDQQKALTRMKKINIKPRYKEAETDYRRQSEE